jgi:hypothetical protein
VNDREVDIGLGDNIEQVCENVLGRDSENLHDLAISETGVTHRVYVGAADVTALAHDLGGEVYCCVRLCVAGFALPVESDLLRSDLGKIQTEVGVRRKVYSLFELTSNKIFMIPGPFGSYASVVSKMKHLLRLAL